VKEQKKTGAARTQPATLNEEWSDERLKLFLTALPPEGMEADYAILLKAYRGMTAELFARFVPFFVEAGHDINVKSEDGDTFLDLVSRHRRSADYASALVSAGAKKNAKSPS
jgi:hypothetical protein